MQMEGWSEDYKDEAQDLNEKGKQDKTVTDACGLALNNPNNSKQKPDMFTCALPQGMAAERRLLPKPHPGTVHDFTNCAESSFNTLQVNAHSYSDEKSQEVQPFLNSTKKQVDLGIDSFDTAQWRYNIPRNSSIYLESGECSNPNHERDTAVLVPGSGKMTTTSFSYAQHSQRMDSGLQVDIQSKKEENNIRTENRGRNAPGDPLTSGQVTKLSDDNRRIAFLLKELGGMSEYNKKLKLKLAEKEREFETLKMEMDLQENAADAKIAEKAAVLVEEIYHAQKERDAAVLSRLRLANEERDEALLRSKRLEQTIAGLENINPEENDMTLQELLNRINYADTGRAVEKNGVVIVDRIHKTRERKKKITAEEMNAVIEERDSALARCKWLEQDLHHLKEQNQTMANNTRQLTAENNQERALKTQLLATQRERDAALQRCKKQEEEIQMLQVYYSLHKSLSQEASLTEQFNFTVNSYEDALRASEGITSVAHRQTEDLAGQLQLAIAERADLENKLQKALEAKTEVNERVQKLERLVDVLRKKVGAGNIRTVT
ncbi:mirror-image polydactyly gene 1 protein isoform X1 [Callorhinchus milii]|uniref:mirror-image polydactyly gene 1 protein isoform X1 n=1 Tax=Callorhinchus milii TaxID=7868 RepID=UPI001C3F98C9|nr:mirror-image polydactyly gene 1 protein isoform X1 [Callorhinchus milii]XP_007891550.2 mirror-image polydactyly gene 1 protein isoform X1 [Callorhinchus milii]XP_042194182.1 mirror-image polydactyly gene 1 protein isoform X1 [Callorhinchus milii]